MVFVKISMMCVNDSRDVRIIVLHGCCEMRTETTWAGSHSLVLTECEIQKQHGKSQP